MGDEDKVYVDANHENLCEYALHCCQDVGDMGAYKVEHQEWKGRYKVSLGIFAWYVSEEFLPKFWLGISSGEEGWDLLEQVMETEDGRLKELIVPAYTDLPTIYKTEESFGNLTGEDFINIDRRMEGLIKASGQTIREIAHLINKEMDEIAKDTEVVKDFDGILTFDTLTGKDFKLQLCFDKVEPVKENNNAMIMRTPMTKEDGEMYLRDTYPKVLSRLDHVNKIVTVLLESKAVKGHPALFDYACRALDVTLTHAFLNQIVTYVSFGGFDNWRMDGKETPNNKACFKILDAEVEHIIKLLDELPRGEGVDLHSLDLDTLAAFGRNHDNKVVTAAVQGFTEQKLLSRYSKGFERLLSIRLGMNDSPYFFRA